MATKRRMRRFADGGDAYDPDQDIADMQAERDAGSFSAAFRAAQKDPGNTFMWRGKRYTKDMAKPKAAKAPDMAEVTISAKRGIPSAIDRDEDKLPRVQRRGESAVDYMDPTGEKRAALRARDEATTRGLARALMSPIAIAGTEGAVGTAMGGLGALRAARAAGMQEDAVMAANAAKRAAARKTDEEIARKVESASDRRTRKLAEDIRKEANRKRITEYPGIRDSRRAPSDADLSGVIEGYKRGGKAKVKKYARGGGIEQRGKTRGRFV